jgi:hypothetical protein
VLAVRVIHEDAKSADRTKFTREQRVFVELFWDGLTPSERRRLRAAQVFERSGLFRATGAASRLWRRAGLPPMQPGARR